MRRYLAALEGERKGGKRRLTDSINNRILKIDELLVTADPLTRLLLTQERIDLHGEQIRYANGVSEQTTLAVDVPATNEPPAKPMRRKRAADD